MEVIVIYLVESKDSYKVFSVRFVEVLCFLEDDTVSETCVCGCYILLLRDGVWVRVSLEFPFTARQ